MTIEFSYDPAMVGSELARDFKIEGNRLTIITAPAPSPRFGNHMAQTNVVLERATP